MAVQTDKTLEDVQQTMRVKEVGVVADTAKVKLMKAIKAAARNASRLREARRTRLRDRRAAHKKKRRCPHGPGTALFPVPRVDWKQKGQSNSVDFGRLVVGDFLMWRMDILDITFTDLVYRQFKVRLETEIARALL